jgi:hypothetical protein
MKKDEVPQDGGMMGEGVSEITYATDENGRYVMVSSVGWEPKNVAMKQAWDVVNRKIEEVREKVLSGELSPLAYHMEKNLMDVGLLSGYAGFSRFRVKRHLKPRHFNRLKPSVLKRYAGVFGISVETLCALPREPETSSE